MFCTSSIRANADETSRAYRFFGAGILGSSLLHLVTIGGIVILWHSRLTVRNVIPVEIVMVRTRESSSKSKEIPTPLQAFQSVVGNAKRNPVPIEDAAPELVRSNYAFQAASKVANSNIASLMVSQAANDPEAHALADVDVINLLRAQIERCWFPPSVAPPPKGFGIDLHIALNIDGSIAEPPKLIASGSGFDNDRTQAFIEAAQRAIYTCGPYRMPAAEYSLWHEVDVPRFFPIEK